jgi:hypothetical protein
MQIKPSAKNILQCILTNFSLPNDPDNEICDTVITASLKNGYFLSTLTTGVRMKNKLKQKRCAPFLVGVLNRLDVLIEHEINTSLKDMYTTLRADLQNLLAIARLSP